jgi:hypothetical protein
MRAFLEPQKCLVNMGMVGSWKSSIRNETLELECTVLSFKMVEGQSLLFLESHRYYSLVLSCPTCGWSSVFLETQLDSL